MLASAPKYSSDARQARIELATALIWADRFGFSEGICNHFSISTVENNRQGFLINPQGYHWSEITPESLIFCESDSSYSSDIEPTAYFIHSKIHKNDPLATAVFHTHMPYATALSCLENMQLEMTSQNALRFYNRITYIENYNGLILDADAAEGLVKPINKHGIVLLANHGVVSVAATAAQAINDLYYFERACEVQFMAMSSGRKLKQIKQSVIEHTSKQFNSESSTRQADAFFESLQRKLTFD